MARYVVESTFFEVHHGTQRSKGVVGVGPGKEKIYLHVLELADSEIGKLGPRVTEEGNRESDRRALPNNEEWWIAVDGEKTWPGIVRPKVRSRCDLDASGAPHPHAIDAEEREALAKAGVGP
ncbi:MAG: hypothetical protein U0414_27060 [Polyangiaceae bacterium]